MPDPNDWLIFGAPKAHEKLAALPEAPPWRSFARKPGQSAPPYVTTPAIDRAVNAALYLRRPLLVTGGPGTGKSSLAREVARQLNAERFLKWPINSKSTLGDALYRYDAIGRLRDANLASLRRRGGRRGDGGDGDDGDDGHDGGAAARDEKLGSYLTLGPLGTALVAPGDPRGRNPIRVLLIDEIDKSDLDLPNDLLDVLEDGQFVVPELQRIAETLPDVAVGLDRGNLGADEGLHSCTVTAGRVRVQAERYPFILVTSNGERDFSPAFMRRCVRLDLGDLDEKRAREILEAHLGRLEAPVKAPIDALVDELMGPRERSRHAVDQLLNVAWMLARGGFPDDAALLQELKGVVARRLDAE